MIKPVVAVTSAILPSLALAHAGHDHSHWMSEPLHAISALAVVALLAATGWTLRSTLIKRDVSKDIGQEDS